MKATNEWIDSYVGTGLDADAIASALTLSGTEVEHRENVGDDVCMTLEVTSNRTDCLSIFGLARELAACNATVAKVPPVELPTSGTAASEITSVTIEPDALDACPFYSARVIRGIKVGPSPDWLKRRLEGIGLKPINNVVDITNYVLFETGQPLHAFDLAKLDEGRIVVRMATDGEAFNPIADRKQRDGIKLDPQTLVIADASRPQAIGGVMGGADSQVTETTTDILLESAYFEPTGNKATSRRLQLDSDSSYRFERDVDQGGVLAASERASALILELAGGELLDGVVTAGELKPESRELSVNLAEVERIAGIPIGAPTIEKIFTGLGLKITACDDTSVGVQVPSYRPDLTRSIDLVEEVIRVFGIDEIPSPLRLPVSPARPTALQRFRKLTRRTLLGQGFHEALSDTFVATDNQFADFSPFSDTTVRLEARNPVNSKLPSLRRNLLNSLLLACAENQRQGADQTRLYEIAKVFLPSADTSTTGEREVIGLLGDDYFDVKGAIEELTSVMHLNANVTFNPYSNAIFADGRAASVHVGDKQIGVIGEASKKAQSTFDVEGRCGLAELDLEALHTCWVEVPMLESLPKFPSAERDLAFVLSENVSWADIQATVGGACSDLLRDVTFFDEFRGKQIGSGKKSIAFRLVFRHDDRTLTNEEITEQMNLAINAVTTRLSGELRGA